MKIAMTLWVVTMSFMGFTQNYMPTQRRVTSKPTNQDLYGLRYELKHYAFGNGDSTILTSINFELLPAEREQSVDVEVYDSTIDQIIILYSFDKMEEKYLEKRVHN
ncbi:MAG: hypothetical protein AB8B56_08910 [Crocinitomicaceae bacterium]